MKIFSTILLAIIFSFGTSAQTKLYTSEERDSLLSVWENERESDSIRLKALYKVAFNNYSFNRLDTAIYYVGLIDDYSSYEDAEVVEADFEMIKGACYYKNQQFKKAISKLQDCIMLYEKHPEQTRGMSKAYSLLGNTYKKIGKLDSTKLYYSKSLKYAHLSKDENSLGKIYYDIGSLRQYQGYLNNAITAFDSSLYYYSKIDYKKGIASNYSNIGFTYDYLGDFDKAIDYYNKALSIYIETEDIKGLAITYLDMGLAYYSLGEYAKSYEYTSKAMSSNEKRKDTIGLAGSTMVLGLLSFEQGSYDEALNYYDKCLDYYKAKNSIQGEAQTLNNMGLVYQKRKEFEQAQQIFSKSLKIKKQLGDKNGVIVASLNLAILNTQQKQYDKALKQLKKTLKLCEEFGDLRTYSYCLFNIGVVHYKMGAYKEAANYYYSSLEKSNNGLAKEKLNTLKGLYRNCFMTDSISKANDFLHTILSENYKNIKMNFMILPEDKKENFHRLLEQNFNLYHDFALFYNGKYPYLADSSFNIALKNKGLTLKSSVAVRNAILKSNDSTLINNYKEWIALKNAISQKYSRGIKTDSLEAEAEILERQMIKNFDAFNDINKIYNIRWQDVQAELNKKEAAIEFIRFKSKIDTLNPIIYAALVVKKDSKHPEIIRLCNESELSEILGVIQGNDLEFVNSVYGTKEKANTALYEKIWKPLEKSLSEIDNIYFSPTGLLHKIAFDAIAKEKNTYLCDAYNIRQQNSTSKLVLGTSSDFNEDQKILMVGGVQYNTDTSANEVWAYLPGTLEETKNIKSILEKSKFGVEELTNNKAEEGVFKEKATEANILHIATHGFFFPDPSQVQQSLKENEEYHEELAFRGQNISPKSLQRSTRYADWTFVKNKNPLMRSGITFAHANDVWQRPASTEGQDGILTAQEVSNMDLSRASLVVLSACETGLGDIKGSEGVFGLQRAFKMAGARQLIMSLWQVPDEETSEFMQLFYTNLVKEGDISNSFDLAQKQMRLKYDPYFWAAFVLVE